MSNTIFQTTEKVLTESGKYSSNDGKLLRNLVLENAEKMDKELLSVLMNNEETKKTYFTEVDGIQIFDKVKFSWIIQNKEFLPDSYTRYKNKIGLTNSRGEFISTSNDVELVFPYKDCILEGGQTKEDQKNNEIFYNETLAPDQVSNLLAPKAFCNAKKYDKDCVHEVTEITDEDNLIIKGNNLLALSSLLEKYRGKVKCIYIDPPYNTGGDSFGYNDKFNHSSWLTFMKNRLELARKLLSEDGMIWIHCDNNEQPYLKVLLDEIFGRGNFIETITVVNNPRGRDYGGIANMHEYIHVYAKNALDVTIFRLEDENKDFPFCDDIGGYEIRELRNRNTAFHIGNRPNLCYPFFLNPKSVDENNFCEIDLEDHEGWLRVMPAKSRGIQTVWRWGKEKARKNLNVNLVGRAMKENGRYMIVEKYREKKVMARSVWWDKDVNSEKGTIHLRELFGDKVFSFPKPETLLERILNISTENNDLVLDFHLGSGTTAAVAHKMNRRYIGVEQMDYIEPVTCERLKKVIAGEQGGISKSQNWQGGGSFIYCELAKLNQNFVDKIKACKNDKEIKSVTDKILKSDFVSSKVKPSDINTNAKDYSELSFEEKQQLAMALLDKNQLYVNFSERKDPDMKLSENDIKFTESFYNNLH